MERKLIANVEDRRSGTGVIGSWMTEPMDPERLTEEDKGRTVIYIEFDGSGQAGTLSSWNSSRSTVWARFSSGSTGAACNASDLVWGVEQL